MKYQLIKPMVSDFSAVEQILYNRNIPKEKWRNYLNTTDKDVNSPLAFGKEVIHKAAQVLAKNIAAERKTLVIVDCDCDGYTSSALLINYLHDFAPCWTETKLEYFMHSGKQHGLSDCWEYILKNDFKMVLIPDAASNDYEYLKILKENDIDVIILDHHEAEKISEDAVVINNQLSDYPNKFLSGVGVTWQFCRYIDLITSNSYADDYLDLVATGLTGDMMSMTEIETKHLITKGFMSNNIKNPFIAYMADKNDYSLGGKITPIGAAFYIVPFINAIVRSGTQEEKELIFKSMLKHEAFKKVLSTKRGHKLGEQELLVVQAIRTATNVKRRQTTIQDNTLAVLEKRIEDYNLLDHKVLLFLVKDGEVDRNVAGLVANKFMAKYQRPCCILTRVENEEGISYQGSARGCDKVGITEFKDICAATDLPKYTAGHQGAFGLGLAAADIDTFISKTDDILKDMPNESMYYVDYIYENFDVSYDNILDIAGLDDMWGKDFDESLICIKGLKVSKNMVSVYRKKDNTLKIALPNGVSIMKFKADEKFCSMLENTNGYIELDIVGTCSANNFNGNTTPQIFIEDYEIVDSKEWIF